MSAIKQLTYCLFAIIQLAGVACAQPDAKQIDLGTLLNDVVDRKKIAEFPNPEFLCQQCSSYNRESIAPDKPGWFANADSSFFYGHQDVDGRREWIMMDVDGPGAIVRWWLTQQKFKGTVRIYLDGSKQPIYEATADALVGGETIVGKPLSNVVGWNGRNLYLPIPFRKHCRITYDGPNLHDTGKFEDCIYYNINYLKYPKGTNVKTLTKEDMSEHSSLLDRVQKTLLLPEEHRLAIERKAEGRSAALHSGESLECGVDGGGAISSLRVKLDADDIEQAMRSVVIRISFDGEEMVQAPIGGFFGTGPGLNPFQDWWRQVEKDGWMTCWWPMPFKSEASIKITNFGSSDVAVELDDIGISNWNWTDRTLYFHSSWRSENQIATDEVVDWNYLTVEGKGVYVGDTLAVYNNALLPHPKGTGTWWGEGDEKIFVDREPFPSTIGTGTEDYYGYSWGVGGTFQAPFHSMPRGDANGSYTKPGHTTNSRVRSLDRIPFKSHLKFDMELLHWQKTAKLDYAATTHWYALNGATGNGEVTPEKVRVKVGQEQTLPVEVKAFPADPQFTDLFAFNNDTPVKSVEDWRRRRQELIELLMFYQYGRIPPKPDQVTARLDKQEEHPSRLGTLNMMTLIIGSEKKLEMQIALYKPKTPGPHPVIIEEDGNPGVSKNVPLFLAKNYIHVEYARHHLDPDKNGVVGPAQQAYPEYDWATLAVWAWGGMRVVDYLETRDDIDMKRIAITGHSRGGKATLLAAALDDRIGLAVPNGSGAGGGGASRVLGPGAESIGMNDKPHWYHERVLLFSEREAHLPFDQHFVKALVAPRGLLCIESTDDLYANPVGTYASSNAAMPVFELFGRAHVNGIAFRRGGHTFSTDDWKTLRDYAEWTFFGRGAPVWQQPAPVEPDPQSGGAPGFVAIGDPGNAPDVDYPRVGAFGAVAHAFEIGRHKVSNAEYVAFLNAAAKTDPHDLFHPRMRIRRAGYEGDYSYSAYPASARAAVTYVSWHDALRYCNWVHGGDVESGAYAFAGQTRVGVRESGARYFLPTEDEWYKAAYYDPKAKAYRLLPLRNMHALHGDEKLPPKSSYGMLGAADSVWEWTESKVGDQFRGLRSGSWFQGNNPQAKGRFYSNPDLELGHVGFRVGRRVN